MPCRCYYVFRPDFNGANANYLYTSLSPCAGAECSRSGYASPGGNSSGSRDDDPDLECGRP